MPSTNRAAPFQHALDKFLSLASRLTERTRERKRMTLPSTTGTLRLKAMEATAPAVYAPGIIKMIHGNRVRFNINEYCRENKSLLGLLVVVFL